MSKGLLCPVRQLAESGQGKQSNASPEKGPMQADVESGNVPAVANLHKGPTRQSPTCAARMS